MVLITPIQIKDTISRDKLIDKSLKVEFNDIKDKYFRSHATYHHIYKDNVIDKLTDSVKKNHDVLKLLLFGVNLIGEKRAILLDNVDLYIDVNPYMYKGQVKIKKSIKKHSESLARYHDVMIRLLMQGFNNMNAKLDAWKQIVIKDMTIIESKDIKLHRKNKSKFIRIFFYNNIDRVAAIEYLTDNGFKTYSNEKCKNDISNIVGRIYDFKYGNDIDVSLAKPYAHENIKVPCSILDINDVRYVSEQEKSKHLLLFSKRRFLVMGFDIEVHGKLGKEVVTNDINDKIKTINLSLFWNGDNDPVARIALCYGYIPDDPSMITVTCVDQETIVMVFAEILDILQPDYELDFNGGGYDWKKIRTLLDEIRTVLDEQGLMAKFYHTAACYVPCVSYTQMKSYQMSKALYPRKFKIDATTIIDAYMINIPGCIMFDIQNPLRKINKTVENSYSLKVFLNISKLPPKKDMSVRRMFYIYDEGEKLGNDPFIKVMRDNFLPFMTQIYDIRKREYDVAIETNVINFELLNDSIPLDRAPLTVRVLDAASKCGEWFSTLIKDNIDKLFDYIDHLIGYYDIRTYCDRDAESCYRLFNKNFWYFDAAEMSSLANICISDAHWKADGMKVINFICKYAHKWGYIIDLLSVEPKENAKYPGAFVILPKSGHYKFKPKLFYKRNVQIIDMMSNIIDNKHSLDDEELGEFKEQVRKIEGETIDDERKNIKERIIYNLNLFNKFQTARNKKRVNALIATIQRLDIDPSKESIQLDIILHIIIECNFLGFPIVALDFSSLYPNTQRTYNLSPETIIRDPIKAAKYKALGWKLHEISFKYGTRDILAWSLLWDPQGKRVECIYGSILGDLFELRKDVKRQLEEFPLEWMRLKGLENTPMYAEAAFLAGWTDGKQKAIKVIMNTLYGKAGDTSSALFMPEISGGTTVAGKMNLKRIHQYVTEEEGIMIKYGDTDSLYQLLALKIYQAAYDEFIEFYEHNMEDITIDEIEREKRFRAALLDYSTKIVQITMDFMPGLSKRVSNELFRLTGVDYFYYGL